MIGVEQLKTEILARCQLMNKTHAHKRKMLWLPLHKAMNHILAQDVTADFDLPRQNLSAMDGFALAMGSDLSSNAVFEVIGESCAGKPFDNSIHKNQAVRIFTGAVVPTGCDTVVMQENTDFEHIKAHIDKSKTYQMTLTAAANHGSNIRKQGEEIAHGETVLTAGKRINPADVSLLASLGVDKVLVFAPLVVGVLATGDELVSVGAPLTHSAQIYNSNTPSICALLARLPIVVRDFGIVADDLDETVKAVKQAIVECDVIISSAGVSVGDYDFLTSVVNSLGTINHYKVAMKPGKPFVFGEFKHGDKEVLYFGLPGNPLSTIVGTLQFVRPAIWRLTGCADDELPRALRLTAICQSDIHKKGNRQEFMRAHFWQDSDGEFWVRPFAGQDSHRVKQMSLANCLLVLPADCAGVTAGEKVLIEPFEWCFG